MIEAGRVVALGFFIFTIGCVSNLPMANLATAIQCHDAPSASDHIIGGTKVDIGDPDHNLVSMLKVNHGNRDSICTSSLISDRILLTAAHCVDNVSPGEVLVQFRTNLGCPLNQIRFVRIEVDQIYIHAKFDGTPQSLSDIAIVYLSGDAPQDQVRLPVLNSQTKITSDKLLLIGFGITSEINKDSQILRRVYKSYNKDISRKDKILIVNQSMANGGFCRGDSGAPIIAEVWGEPHIIGVNSANIGIKPNTECQTMSLAMDVTYFSDWITRNQKKIESSNWFFRLFQGSNIRTE